MEQLNRKPKVYIAGPFFNEPQTDLICKIQRILRQQGYPYYSPMLDSGSADLTPEQKKDPASWKPVFHR